MHEFIHTFSAVTYLFREEKDMLTKIYHKEMFYNSTEKIFVLSKYAEQGLRIHLEFSKKEEKKYDKKHREYRAELIITPAKLIYPGGTMKKLFTAEEYKLAMEKLETILKEIQLSSGVSLWNDTKLRRMDLSKDIITESDEHSKEIIRLSKLALHKTGYHLWMPSKEEIEKTGWQEADSAMFYNHNREISAKLYDKIADLRNQHYDVSDMKGLLRFELSLKRNFLKDRNLIQKGNTPFTALTEIFSYILKNAGELMQTYIVGPLWDGHFLSRKLQKKYIRKYCKTKVSKMEKMLKYRDDCRRGILVMGGKVMEYFKEIGLSPLCTSKAFPYIPSFSCLLYGEENEMIKAFVEREMQENREHRIS